MTRDGAYENYVTEQMANGVRVRIGSAGRSINTGSHLYVIKYRTTRQIGFFEKYDELYWNATGTGWTFPIDMAEARIHLPENVSIMQSAIYTGPQGARGRDATIVEQKPGFIVFRTTKPLPVANGLTVAAGWPKGVVQEPTQMQKIEAVLKDDPALLTAGVGGGLVIGFYLLAWFLVGRDPRKGTIIPLFGPPKGMSAAGVGFVHGMGMDKRTFAAAIVGLGVNGRLKLVDRGQTPVLRHLKSGKPADAAEQAVETALFASRSSVELDNANHETISGAHHQLHDALKGAYGGLFRNNFWLSGLGLVAAVAATAAIVLRYSESYSTAAQGIFFGIFIPLIPLMIAAAMVRSGWQAGRRPRPKPHADRARCGDGGRRDRHCLSDLQHRLRAGDLARNGPVRAGGVCLARFPLAAGAEQGRPRPHGPDRRLQAVPECRRGRPARIPQSAEEDARTVRALPALCHRAQCRKQLGQPLHRRAGGGRRRRCGVVLVLGATISAPTA